MKKISALLLTILAGLYAAAQNCPTIHAHAPADQITAGDTVLFFAEVKPDSTSLTYNWSVSNGTIISGQGTNMIQVVTDSLGGLYITATVEAGGLPLECISTSSVTIDVQDGPEKIISGNYTTPQALAASVKKFIMQTDLANINISQTAFIYVYGGPTTTTVQQKAINAAISKEFEKNGIFPFQYVIADGGKKKTASFEMYKLLPGAKEPKPSK